MVESAALLERGDDVASAYRSRPSSLVRANDARKVLRHGN
jgi:hypothetical protein